MPSLCDAIDRTQTNAKGLRDGFSLFPLIEHHFDLSGLV
jgi:hypothetical protein